MQMTKELEKRLKLMQRFNQVHDRATKYKQEKCYHNKIFIHNDVMYATDGRIFVAADNLTEQKDFSFFKTDNKKFEYLDSSTQEVKEDKKATSDGKVYERLLTQFDGMTVSFDIDFEGYPLPIKLCSNWGTRWRDKLTVNLQTKEAIIDFYGCLDDWGGVIGTYEDIIKNVSGKIPKNPIKFYFWNILEIMKQCKVNKIHIDSNPERNLNACKVMDYTFIFMSSND